MRAVVCKELGPVEKLVLDTDWQVGAPGPDEVVIDVKAGGLNFPDTLIIQGKYQVKPELPFVPGGECAGVISAVGSNVEQQKVGDKVIVVGSHGAFSEQLVTKASGVLSMPESLSFIEAAGIGMTYFTSYYALKQRAQLKAGETVLVLGAAGGVGITAVEIAKAMGATVIAAASTDEKLALAKEKGADHLINYSEQNLKDTLKELTGGKGVDVVYDPVGGDFSEAALRCMAWKGRFLVIGFANGEIPKIPLNLTLLKGCDIRGVFFGAFSAKEPAEHRTNISELWAMFDAGQLKPVVTDVFPMTDYVGAFRCLTERRAKGKVILDLAQ
jgi:NADPH2:quinone reductase|tara:strand:+ start:535 stop:1518 length:984 start_codon:yes stop_codon:yes gene_type:complete